MSGVRAGFRKLFYGSLNSLPETKQNGGDSVDVEAGIQTRSTLYELTPTQLLRLVDPKNPTELAKLGGVQAIARKLSVDSMLGLSETSRILSQATFGRNILPAKTPPSLLKMMLDAFLDKMLLLLTVAALVSLAIGIYQDIKDQTFTHWIEGTAILVAVALVVLANALNDYQREKQFQKLSASAEARLVKVLRDGRPDQISIFDLAEVMPADGILIEGFNVECDESNTSGESDAIRKGDPNVDPKLDPFLISGTKVIDGTGSMLVIAVGENSYHGRMMMALQEDSIATPLQIKLARLADIIAKLGVAIALTMFMALTIKYIVQLSLSDSPLPNASLIIERMLLIIIETITIVVVAVPEGLPMAVTLALAYATTRMLKDNNLVRVLAACETMGNATCICSDKTGTLTENKMTVVKGMIGDTEYHSQASELESIEQDVKEILNEAIAINSTAFETEDPQTHAKSIIGSKTEAALISFMIKNNADYRNIRLSTKTIDVFPFSSARKSMITVIEAGGPGMVRIHIKGASELLLNACKKWLRSNGKEEIINADDLRNLRRFIAEMAEESLRTIAVAYREMTIAQYEKRPEDGPPLENLTLIALFGIEDPLRLGVPEAVSQCQNAGIFIRMVTGDNVITAQAIARKCGILMRGGIVMEGPRFRELDDQALELIVPRLQVLARSSPLDKQILVRKLKAMNEIVAVTGDGCNDGPALKSANVGFAMGIAGTEVAKEASSIVLLDDNFASIVKAVSWGRCVNDSVRKFLQFQLTVNISAVLIAFISAIFDPDSRSVLTTVQLLWVNLIMDTFAALALATDKPMRDILDRQPEPIHANLVNTRMIKIILGQALFQVTAILIMIHLGHRLFHLPNDENSNVILATLVFNTFVFLQLFNEINCRILDGLLNPFRGILYNRVFIGIWLVTALVQALLVTFGGIAFSTVPLSWTFWLISIGISMLSLPVALIIRLLPDWNTTSADSERIVMTRERLHWQAAIGDVRRSLAFYSALRRARKPISIHSLEK